MTTEWTTDGRGVGAFADVNGIDLDEASAVLAAPAIDLLDRPLA